MPWLDITKSFILRKNRSWSSVTALSFIALMLLSAPAYTLGFSKANHEEITREALPFLGENILSVMIKHLKAEDDFPAGWQAKNHFDACDWDSSIENINEKYEDQSTRSLNKDFKNPFSSPASFGKLLHPVQDFYSHSNWAEISDLWSSMGFRLPIVDNLLTPWEMFNRWNNIRSLNLYSGHEEDFPDNWKMSSPFTPKGLTPEIITEDTSTLMGWGIFTHGRPFTKGGDDCSSKTHKWEHDELNKDDDNHDGYRGDRSKYVDFVRDASLSLKIRQIMNFVGT